MTQRLAGLATRHAGPLLGAGVFALALVAVRALLREVDIDQIGAAIARIPATMLWAATLSVAGSYAFLIGYDASALRYVGRRVPAAVMAVGSFSAYALGNTAGVAVLSGGAVRHRFYRRFGLSLREITIVSTFCAVAFGVSVSLVGLAALIGYPQTLSRLVAAPESLVRWAGGAALLVCIGSLAVASYRAMPIGIGRFRLRLPTPSVLVAQVVFSLGELTLAALALYLLVPGGAGMAFLHFVSLFAAASLAAALSHVPGGIGVFDGLLIAGLNANGEAMPDAVAAVLAFRALYYLGPFLMSLALLCSVGPWLTRLERRGERSGG